MPPDSAVSRSLTFLLLCAAGLHLCAAAPSPCTQPGPLRVLDLPAVGSDSRGALGAAPTSAHPWCLDSGSGALYLAPCQLYRHTQWWHPPSGRNDQLAQAAPPKVLAGGASLSALCADAPGLALKACPSPVRPSPRFTFTLDAQSRWVLSEAGGGGKAATCASLPSSSSTAGGATRHRSGTAAGGADKVPSLAGGAEDETAPGGSAGAAADLSASDQDVAGPGPLSSAAIRLVPGPCDGPGVLVWEQPACGTLPPLLETHHNWARGAPAVLSTTISSGGGLAGAAGGTQQTVTPVSDGFPEDHGWSNVGCVGIHSGERDDELYPWVTLDLGRPIDVHTVQVWTRTACSEYSAYLCQNRLWRYSVFVGDEPPPAGLPEQGQYALNGPPCAAPFDDDHDVTPRPVYSNAECRKRGRYVTVQQMASLDVAFPGVMNICQIRVLGALPPMPAGGAMHTLDSQTADAQEAAQQERAKKAKKRWKLRLPKLFRRKVADTPTLVTWRPPRTMGLTATAVVRAAIDAGIATAALWAVLRITPPALRLCARGLDVYGRGVPGAARLANALRRAGTDMPILNEAVFDGELGGAKKGGELGDKES